MRYPALAGRILGPQEAARMMDARRIECPARFTDPQRPNLIGSIGANVFSLRNIKTDQGCRRSCVRSDVLPNLSKKSRIENFRRGLKRLYGHFLRMWRTTVPTEWRALLAPVKNVRLRQHRGHGRFEK